MTFAASQSYLAYIPSPPRGVWHLGPLPIRAYAFFIITGIIIGLLIGDRRWASRGGERGVIYDIALWMVPFGLVGGRLYHLATDWQTYWGPGGAGTAAALRIWDGGLGIWGAVALGAVGAWIGCKRHGVPLPAFLDAVAPGLVLAQAIGRLGNYFNQELYGRETKVPWGLEIFDRRDPSVPLGYVDVHMLDGVSTGHVHAVVHPTFLYELLWNLLVFGALLLLDRRFTLGHGRLFASYVALYCIGRFGVELMRDDSATHIAGIRINTFTSTFVFIGAVVYIMLAPKGREDPELLRSRWADDDDDDDDDDEEDSEESEPAEELAAVGAVSLSKATGSGVDVAADSEAEVADEPEVAEPKLVEPEEPAEVAAAEVEEPELAGADTEVAESDAAEVLSEEPEVDDVHELEPAEAEAESDVAEVEAAVADAEAAKAERSAEEVEAVEVAADEADVDAEVDAEADEAEAELLTEEPEAAEAEQAETDEAEQAETDEAEQAETNEPEPEPADEPEPVAEEAEPSVEEEHAVEAEQESDGPDAEVVAAPTAEPAETEAESAEAEAQAVDEDDAAAEESVEATAAATEPEAGRQRWRFRRKK